MNQILIVYTNWRGETDVRRVIPISLRFASSDWHPEKQMLLEAYDVDKQANRSFAVKDIKGYEGPELLFQTPESQGKEQC